MVSTIGQVTAILVALATGQASTQTTTAPVTVAEVARLRAQIGQLKESVDKIDPDMRDVIENIDAMYSRALTWMLVLFGGLVGAVTILAILVSGIMPWLFQKRERAALEDERRRNEESLTEYGRRIEDALATVAEAQTSLDTIKQDLVTVRTDLEAEINQRFLLAKGDLDWHIGTISQVQGLSEAAFLKFKSSASRFMEARYLLGVHLALKALLEQSWTPESIASVQRGHAGFCKWVDAMIEFIEESDTDAVCEDELEELQKRRQVLDTYPESKAEKMNNNSLNSPDQGVSGE